MINRLTIDIELPILVRRCLYIETGPRVYIRIIYTKLGHWANAAHTGNIGSVLDQLWSPTPKYMLWRGSYRSYMY